MSRVEITSNQRKFILERDEYHCHFPIRYTDYSYRPSRRTDKLQIHHIVAYRFAQEYLGWSVDQINSPYNLITLSEHYHIGVIHPDIVVAKEKYRQGDKEAFNYCFSHRRKLCDEGKPYWFTLYDEVLTRIAKERTDKHIEAGNVYPQRMRRLQVAGE